MSITTRIDDEIDLVHVLAKEALIIPSSRKYIINIFRYYYEISR